MKTLEQHIQQDKQILDNPESSRVLNFHKDPGFYMSMIHLQHYNCKRYLVAPTFANL